MRIRSYKDSDREPALALAPRLVEGIAPWRDERAARASYIDTVAWSIDHGSDDDIAVFVAEDDEGFAGIVTVMERGHFTGQKDAYVDVLREGMAIDSLQPAGLYVGTNTGQLFHTADEGDSWREAPAHFPAINSVGVATV